MIDQKRSSIDEAPSLADISASNTERVGRVDFSTRLGAEEPTESDARPTSAVALTAAQPKSSKEPVAASTRATPLILPPAKVDEAMAAEAARIRREIAEARGDVIVVEDADPDETHETDDSTPDLDAAADDETSSEPESDDDREAAADEADVPPTATPVPRFRRATTPSAPVQHEPAAVPASERLLIQDVASLDEIAEEVAEAEAVADEAAARAEAEANALREESEAAAAFESAAAESLAAGPIEDIDNLLDDEADDDLLPVGIDQSSLTDDDIAVDQSVADVAASVIATMRSIGDAHERHLEAIELAAARRCELLTAQAELDAELIRLHARREAHAIISAARMRAGGDLTPVETDQLSEIGETFSRFAETIETTIASGPASPDITRKS